MTIDKATATLWVAIEHRDVVAAKAAIEAGADVNARNRIDETALHHAAAFNSSRMVTLLLDSGADANVKDYAGQTPLDIAKAAASPRPRMIAVLEAAKQQGHAGRVIQERKDKGPPQVGG